MFIKIGKENNIFRLEVPKEVYAAYLTNRKENAEIMQLYDKHENMGKAMIPLYEALINPLYGFRQLAWIGGAMVVRSVHLLSILYKEPVLKYSLPERIAAKETVMLVYVIPKSSISKKRQAILELNEKDGERNLKLKIPNHLINHSK